MQNIEITILMPCLNEAETLAICINKAKKFLTTANVRGEVLIADNGSTDGSQDIAKAHGARVVAVPTRGYGAALKSGIKAAQGNYIIMADADDSYDFLNLTPFLTKLREGYDLVMGNRFKGGIVKGAMPLLNRYLGNPVLSFLGRIFFKTSIGDFHCGLRGFKRDSFLALELQGDGMEFASEMIAKATFKNLKITEVPTSLYPDGRNRRPHLRPWRDGWRHLRLLFLLSPRWLFLYPGLSLILIGLLLMSMLITGPIVINHIYFDIHTMLFSGFFMIAGLQAVCFAIFSKLISEPYRHTINKDFSLRIIQHFTLERGLLVGFIFLIVGGIGACYSFWYWAHQSFGPLLPTQMMRMLIPAITSLVIGLQLMFASFFMSVLKLNLRN